MRERRCDDCVEFWPLLRPHTKGKCPLKGAMKVKGKRVVEPMEPVPRKKLRSRGASSPIPPNQKFDLDLDLLACPICTDFFIPPVYQCQNGHLICATCCKKIKSKGCPSCQAPIRRTRCISMDKIMESLTVGCKHAAHGCSQMLKCIERAGHEKICENAPNFPCPVLGCIYDGTKFTLPMHLKEQHEVPMVDLNVVSRTVGFRMQLDDRLVMIKGIGDTMFLLHREFKEGFDGEIFFCTSFGVNNMSYELKVRLFHGHSKTYSLADVVTDVRMVDECRDEDFLLYSFSEADMAEGYDIELGISEPGPSGEPAMELSSNEEAEGNGV